MFISLLPWKRQDDFRAYTIQMFMYSKTKQKKYVQKKTTTKKQQLIVFTV